MTIEELHAKKLCQEIDRQVLMGLLKAADVSEKKIEEKMNNLTKRQETEIKRDLMGGNESIHKIDDDEKSKRRYNNLYI